MALNATLGAVDANSYATQAEADAYFGDRIHASDWEDFEEKEKVLITSSQLLDWYINWRGTKASSTQAMQWPRSEALRNDGTEILDTELPPEVKVAVYELALDSLDTDRTAEDALAGIEQLKAGSLMIKADNGDVNSTAKKVIPEKIWKILSDLYSLGTIGVRRLVRA